MLSYIGSDRGQSIYYKKLLIREIVSFNNRGNTEGLSHGKENAKKNVIQITSFL